MSEIGNFLIDTLPHVSKEEIAFMIGALVLLNIVTKYDD